VVASVGVHDVGMGVPDVLGFRVRGAAEHVAQGLHAALMNPHSHGARLALGSG
jgi:hypothetical protein